MSRLDELCGPGEVVTVRREDLIREPAPVLASLCAFLGVDPYPGYLEDCAAVVFDAPTGTRRRVDWPAALRRDLEQMFPIEPPA